MSSEAGVFIDQCLAGELLIDEIDGFVASWHASSTNVSLAEYLGMTEQEYAVWVERPESLAFILAARRFGTTLEDMLAAEGGTALAARAADKEEAARLLSWLLETGRI